MRRDDLTFEYLSGDVAEAAQGQLEHHQKRLDYWKDEREFIKEKIEEAGLQIRERQVTGGTNYEVVADQELQQRFNQCHRKIDQHREKIEEYDKWVKVLRNRPETEPIWLDMEDILYFNPEGKI